MNDLNARIEALIRSTDPDGLITVRWLARLSGLEHLLPDEGEADPNPFTTPDLTVPDVAARFDKAPTTIRDWCRQGRFPEAYRLRGREWRIPPADVEAFIEAERNPEGPRWAA